MAHYAFLDANNVVVKVITGVDENVTKLNGDVEVGGSTEAWEQYYENQSWHSGFTCKRTSYNSNFRGRYAGIGDTYDLINDVFITPQPFPSWTFDENYDWQPPTPKPEGNYAWFEPNRVWIEIIEP